MGTSDNIPNIADCLSEIKEKIKKNLEKRKFLDEELFFLNVELTSASILSKMQGKDPRKVEPERPPDLPQEILSAKSTRITGPCWRHFFMAVKDAPNSFFTKELKWGEWGSVEARAALRAMVGNGWLEKKDGYWSKTSSFPHLA